MKYSLPPQERSEENIEKASSDIITIPIKNQGLKNTEPYPHVKDVLKKLKRKTH